MFTRFSISPASTVRIGPGRARQRDPDEKHEGEEIDYNRYDSPDITEEIFHPLPAPALPQFFPLRVVFARIASKGSLLDCTARDKCCRWPSLFVLSA